MTELLIKTIRENKRYFISLILGLIILSIVTYFFINKEFENNKNYVTDNLIEETIMAINFDKNNINAIINLANLYFQKSRETADTSYYTKIEELFRKHAELLKDNFAKNFILAQIANGRHDFVLGEKLAKEAIAKNPNNSKLYGPLVDALVELGKYVEAEKTLQKMIDMRPDFASLTRVAYFREIHGDIKGAKDTLDQALSAGAPFKENQAWLITELGKLNFRTDIEEARKNFELALEIDPNYSQAMEWLAKIKYTKGDIKGAIELTDKALEILPIAQYSTLRYNLAKLADDKATAKQMEILTQLTYENSQKNGTNVDMELAQFLAENNIDPKKSLELALRAYQTRKSIYGADVLALAYLKNDNLKEAERYIKEALRLGEYDPKIVYHASLIQKALGNNKEAEGLKSKARSLSPNSDKEFKF